MNLKGFIGGSIPYRIVPNEIDLGSSSNAGLRFQLGQQFQLSMHY